MKTSRRLAKFILSSFVTAFAITLFAGSAPVKATIDFNDSPLLIDVGPSDNLAPSALALSPETKYTADRGFGWVSSGKKDTLERTNHSKSRNQLTIDSVTGRNLKLRIDLPPGEWWVTFWMEAGLEDRNSATFFMNGRKQNLGWNDFSSPAEPRTTLKAQYRLYQGKVAVQKSGLILEWKGKKDLTRLNGVQFIPASPQTDNLQEIDNYSTQTILRLKAAGRFNSTESLDAIEKDLRNHLVKNPSDHFSRYWLHQVSTLAKAEDYFVGLRGWEWARKKTGLSMFGRYNQAIMLIDGLLGEAKNANTHPLYERALYQRGRLKYWLDREGHGNNYDGVAPPELEFLLKQHPDDNILAMYANKKIDTPDKCDAIDVPANAPEWSILQNEVLCRTRLLSHWWINNRQDANGELGGKYGDDVEMLRWWTIPFLAGDQLTSVGWQKLATGVWNSDRLEQGYYKEAFDVEHASEPISDTAPLLAFLNDPEYTNRLGYSADHFLNRWTLLNDQGRRYFKSAWFGALTIDERPPRNRDLPMNGRAAKAVRYYAWKNNDQKVNAALHQLAKAWAHAAMRIDKGKAAGIIPASIRAQDEAINGDEPTWYQANMFWDYFNWEHEAGQQIYDLFLFASQLTGDKTLLEPLFTATNLVKDHIEAGKDLPPFKERSFKEGSKEWAVNRLRHEPLFWSTLEQWRLINDDQRYDSLLLKHGGHYIKYRLTGDKQYLSEVATPILEQIRYNFPMLTREALFTDRVYIAQADNEADPISQTIGMLTGSLRTSSPYPDITWSDTPSGFTALVSESTRQGLTVDTYLFTENKEDIAFRLWRLNKGEYKIKVTLNGKTIHQQKLNYKQRGQMVRLPLPAKEAYQIIISPDK